MMIYLIIGLAILTPLISPNKIKGISLIIAILLLFIPWGLQYEVTWDWEEYLGRWNAVMSNSNTLGSRILEPGYVWLMQICKPIGFFGFLIVCASFFLSVLYLFIRKYVSPKWYWLSILVLMSNDKLGFLLIDTNRQTIAIGLTMLATYLILANTEKHKIKWIMRHLLAVILIAIAVLIHTSAYIAFTLLPLYYIAVYVKQRNLVLSIFVFNFLYFSRYFLGVNLLQNFLENSWEMRLMADNTDFLSGYLEEIAGAKERQAFISYFIELFFCNAFICFYNRMSTPMRFFGLCMLFTIIFEGFIIQSFQRILVFFNIYSIIIIPKILQMFKLFLHGKNKMRELYPIVLIIIVCIHLVLLNRTLASNIYYKKWSTDFVTIFEAPRWK